MSKQSQSTFVRVEVKLLDDVRKEFPETKKCSYTGLVDIALRKLLEMNKK